MKLIVVEKAFQRFEAEVSSDGEREEFIDVIARDPHTDAIVQGTGGSRELRWSCQSRERAS